MDIISSWSSEKTLLILTAFDVQFLPTPTVSTSGKYPNLSTFSGQEMAQKRADREKHWGEGTSYKCHLQDE